MIRSTLFRCRFALSALLVLCTSLLDVQAQVFLSDDPIWEDPDRIDVPAPEPHSIADYYDFWINTFGSPGEYDGPALNVNTLGEVPNSSWYTNRHYRCPMTIEELKRGPNTTDGPARNGVWKVVSGKTEGKTLGIQIEDPRGDEYLLKFDPPGHIELTSGAEVISTKLLYALGYHVPENYAVTFHRDRLEPAADATVETAEGTVPLTNKLIDQLLVNAAQYEDGSYRALASKMLEGDPVGPFFYYETRPDDPNDIFPHEGRRELRGLRTIAAWINHTDARAINSLDVLVEEDGRQFVRHNLIDFGSTFGAGPLGPKSRWDGYEYIIDPGPIALRIFTFGIAGLGWAAIEYPNLDALGYIEAEHFDPEEWRPQYPNAAFIRADDEDAFWAAKQIMHFSKEELAAIISTAEYGEPAVADRLLQILLDRQAAIGREYLDFAGGVDRIAVSGDALAFEDLYASYGFADAKRTWEITWRPFDNETGELGAVLESATISSSEVQIPRSDEAYLAVDVATANAGVTRVYLRGETGARQLVGVERVGIQPKKKTVSIISSPRVPLP